MSVDAVLQKIENKDFTIGIVGLGYVGLPLAVEYARKGFKTIGIDVSLSKVEKLNRGENYISDIPEDHWNVVKESGLFTAQTHFDNTSEIDAIFICVPTPFSENKEPDVSFIVSATQSMKTGLRKGHVIILKSTTFPNTTEGIVMPILNESGLAVGEDYYLAFSPERIDPGNTKWHTGNTPVVVGGVTDNCTRVAATIMKQAVSIVHTVSSPKVGEMEKLLENIFRSVNIALVNELALMCDRVGGINVWEVIEAAATKPFGFMPFFPGPGIGGHCILIDPYYLSWYAKAYDFHSDFIELAAKTNEYMPFYVKDNLVRELAKLGIPLSKAKILMLGIAFKKNVDDTRHSPAIRVMELLFQEGVENISYNDPHVSEIEVSGRQLHSVNLTAENIQSVDLVAITTDHSAYDMTFIMDHARAIYDTRNATKGHHGKESIAILGDGRK